jgi:hypothetical protein
MPCQQFPINNPPLNAISGPYNTLAECQQGCGCSGPCDTSCYVAYCCSPDGQCGFNGDGCADALGCQERWNAPALWLFPLRKHSGLSARQRNSRTRAPKGASAWMGSAFQIFCHDYLPQRTLSRPLPPARLHAGRSAAVHRQ